MLQLPTGTVTFMFTDIEGSTRLLQRVGESYPDLLAEHDRILREAIDAGGGTEVQTEGDGFFAVFPSAAGGLRAAVQAQRGLARHAWPEEDVIRVRIGVHTGEGVLSHGKYVGLDVHRAARIAAAGHGGQVLISDATYALAESVMPAHVGVRDLGRHRLKDIENPERLHQLVIDDLSDAFPPIRTLDARLTNLPPERSALVGREREATEVAALLESSRLLTLTGPGGIGKTRMAMRIAADQLGRFSDGVYLVDLSPITDQTLMFATIGAALMVREHPGRNMAASLAEHLRDREMLLVLDNLEQIVDAAGTVRGLLDTAPGLTVLATSRVPLHLTGEQEYPVPPLALPELTDGADPERLVENEAVLLFIQRATNMRPRLRLSSDDAAAVAQIVVRLDGLPLAIELAASQAKLLDPRTILARLERVLSLGMTGPNDVPDRQRTLRSTIEWSYDLLAAEDQRLFERLSVFRGGWTLASAELICGPGLDREVLDGLAILVDHSVVRSVEAGNGEPRFAMLETIREYAFERLASSANLDELQRSHAEHFRALAEAAEPELTRQDRVAWLARLEQEVDNLRAALDWAEATGNIETGIRTAAAIWRFWQQRGRLSEGRDRLERLLAMPSPSRDEVRARALGALGGIAYWQNDTSVTRASYERAVDLARAAGDPRLLASALFDLSFVPFMDHDANRAESILREGLAVAEDAGDRRLTADFWTGLAFLEFDRGRLVDGIALRRRAIALYREEGDGWKVAENLIGLAMMSRSAGDVNAARVHLRNALGMLIQAKDTISMSGALTGFALVALDDGLPERAARLVGASARIRDDVGGGIPPELFDRWGDPASDARHALGDAAYERSRAEGYAMNVESAVAFADQATPVSASRLGFENVSDA
jgi:predicted ATPase/class 3 adenylate cyclase